MYTIIVSEPKKHYSIHVTIHLHTKRCHEHIKYINKANQL